MPWRTEGGVSSLGIGKARRGSGLGWGPTRKLGTLAVRLAAATWLCLVLLQVQVEMGHQASGAAGSEPQGALGAWWRGAERKTASPGARDARQGSYMLNLGS